MKATIEIEFNIDGKEPDKETLTKAVWQMISESGYIGSEGVDGTEDWGLDIESTSVSISDTGEVFPTWRPIETAPKDGTSILLAWAINANGQPIRWDEDLQTAQVHVQVAAWWEGENDWIVYCSMVRDPALHFKPTHWMPLPEPPKES